MAHDVRNPLASIRGAARCLSVEQKSGANPTGSAQYLDIIVQQADRIAAIVERYQRIGRLEPVLVLGDISGIAGAVIRAQRKALGSRVELVARLADGLPPCRVDRELLAEALENLIRNAQEAMGEGGHIEVSTEVRRGLSYGMEDTVILRVRDDGPGMDARQRELALEEFFSTKPGGTGLGLPFVWKVAEAFGGRAALDADVAGGRW